MSSSNVMERTRTYVAENYLYARKSVVLGTEEPLLASGIIDSMGVLELICFLEAEFGIQVDDEEITEANLGTLGSITRYVIAKRPA